MMCLRFVFFICLAFTLYPLRAQENIPVGEWRIHASFHNIVSLSGDANQIYGAASNGVVFIDKADKEIRTYNKLTGLSHGGIILVNYNTTHDQLFVVYDNGTFDVISGNEVKNFDPSENTVLTGPKEVHDIAFGGDLAYLSTDYGVLLFDMARMEIRETWRDLGATGTTLKIFGSTLLHDSIFLATEKGVLGGDLDDNLLDFNKWKRMASGDLSGHVHFITTFKDQVYVAVNTAGIFAYDGTWQKQAYLSGSSFNSFSAADSKLIVAVEDQVWVVGSDGTVSNIAVPTVNKAADVLYDANGKLWIADSKNGIVSDYFGSFESILPNGPAVDAVYSLRYYQNKMYVTAGGAEGQTPLGREGSFSVLEKGSWTSSIVAVRDVTSISFSYEGEMFLGSFGYGVLQNGEPVILHDETNSTLINTDAPDRGVNISDIFYGEAGLWVANFGASSPLHLFNVDGQWESFSFANSQARYPRKILTDFDGNIWMQLDPQLSGGLQVFNKDQELSRWLNENDESGELPGADVHSIALDRDGYVWVGTNSGVAYFYHPESDAVKPIFENRFLLRDDKVTAIAVDGGNRKWMGTERGVWLFDPTGEKAILNFTEENSPLLSNKITDIEIDNSTGEVFFATDRGLISYRSDATTGSLTFREIKIFPNPVAPTFQGEVGISGLATDAVVKITDVSGKLIYQTTANGGTASWDVRDYSGRRVPTGVFLVFAVKDDGSESIVGKIAVVN
jgi:hypothetical protein